MYILVELLHIPYLSKRLTLVFEGVALAQNVNNTEQMPKIYRICFMITMYKTSFIKKTKYVHIMLYIISKYSSGPTALVGLSTNMTFHVQFEIMNTCLILYLPLFPV